MFLRGIFPRTPIQFAYVLLLVYLALQCQLIYFPRLTWQKVHDCLYHVDEVHCGVPSRDWMQMPREDPLIKLTKSQKEALLLYYSEVESKITPE